MAKMLVENAVREAHFEDMYRGDSYKFQISPSSSVPGVPESQLDGGSGKLCECTRSATCATDDELGECLRGLKLWCLESSKTRLRNEHCDPKRFPRNLTTEDTDVVLERKMRVMETAYPHGLSPAPVAH